ncbi:MAG: hypothetical protein R3A11_09035 [Bdellovibrionota bacterium]
MKKSIGSLVCVGILWAGSALALEQGAYGEVEFKTQQELNYALTWKIPTRNYQQELATDGIQLRVIRKNVSYRTSEFVKCNPIKDVESESYSYPLLNTSHHVQKKIYSCVFPLMEDGNFSLQGDKEKTFWILVEADNRSKSTTQEILERNITFNIYEDSESVIRQRPWIQISSDIFADDNQEVVTINDQDEKWFVIQSQ